MQEKEINRHHNTDYIDLTYLRRLNFRSKKNVYSFIISNIHKGIVISINKIKKAP